MMQGQALQRRRVAAAVAVLALAGVAGGCASLTGDDKGPVSSPSVTWTGARVAASSFPDLPGYRWVPVPDEDWAQSWKVLSSDYHGFLADGQGRYAEDASGNQVAIVAVAWPAPGKGGAAAMKAALDQQGKQATEHYGITGVDEMAGHDVLEFTAGRQYPNWYWVSGDEVVMVTGHDFGQGEAFAALLAAATK